MQNGDMKEEKKKIESFQKLIKDIFTSLSNAEQLQLRSYNNKIFVHV